MSIAGTMGVTGGSVHCAARFKTYPNGTRQFLVCDRQIFGGDGWEDRDPPKHAGKRREREGHGDVGRAIRRAKAQVRDIALCTPFKYFVTLTLDKAKVDRYDMKAITRKLNNWLDNNVRRKGLTYILVPERHKDGAVHFHGFFNDALEAVDSGTISMPGGGKPRRPRSAAQRAQWLEQGGHPVYNLPGWSMGFTTAIELYGRYEEAVSYVCKYIGKGMEEAPNGDNSGGAGDAVENPVENAVEKIGGRWYYSGGDIQRPEVGYCDLSIRDAMERPGAYCFNVPEAGLSFCLFTETLVREEGSETPDFTVSGKTNSPGRPCEHRLSEAGAGALHPR